MAPRSFPAPWTVTDIPGGYRVEDATGQPLGYFYSWDSSSCSGSTRVTSLLKQGAFSTATSECLMVDIRAPRLRLLLWRLLRKFDVPNGLYERIKMCRTFREALWIGVPAGHAAWQHVRMSCSVQALQQLP
jgi:hypothetical protein